MARSKGRCYFRWTFSYKCFVSSNYIKGLDRKGRVVLEEDVMASIPLRDTVPSSAGLATQPAVERPLVARIGSEPVYEVEESNEDVSPVARAVAFGVVGVFAILGWAAIGLGIVTLLR